MKRLISTPLIVFLLIVVTPHNLWAEMATEGEALRVANNWIDLTIRNVGNWGGFEAAKVKGIREFKYEDRHIGYFCDVAPKGFIVISLLKPLAPVKAYSATCDLDPESEKGLTDLIKLKMKRILAGIEKQTGPIQTTRAEEMTSILEIDYSPAWEALAKDQESFFQGLESEGPEMNYQGGTLLLSSSWNQGHPYNRQCPAPPGDDDCTDPHCTVGCGPLAGAMVMHYWKWPPYRDPIAPYDWPDMPDRLTEDPSQAQMDAVARLCHEVGIASGADYCGGDSSPCATGAVFNYDPFGRDLLDAFEDDFRYGDDAVGRDRNDYTREEWFERIQFQINQNRPIPYEVTNHILVCDGWQVVSIDGVLTEQYHMNYGWDDNHTTWWTLDELHLGDEDEEETLENIVPDVAMGSSFSGNHPREDFPFRYFDQDALGSNATFGSGQMLQTLEGVRITGTDTTTTGNYVRFIGSFSSPTTIYTEGNPTRGIRIQGSSTRYGAIRLANNGSINLARLRPPRCPQAEVISAYQINLSWVQGLGMVGPQQYIIERKAGENGVFSYLTTVGATFFADFGTTPYTLYTYRVKMVEPTTGLSSKYSMEFIAITQD